jgi:hypothetical protein
VIRWRALGRPEVFRKLKTPIISFLKKGIVPPDLGFRSDLRILMKVAITSEFKMIPNHEIMPAGAAASKGCG